MKTEIAWVLLVAYLLSCGCTLTQTKQSQPGSKDNNNITSSKDETSLGF